MTLDLETEKTITLATACSEVVPRFTGNAITAQTAARWIKYGIQAGDGSRVKLAAVGS